MWRTGGAFRRREGRTTGVSRNTSPVWCAAYARSPPRARAPSASAGSGPPPSGTTREASDASQSDAGFLPEGEEVNVKLETDSSHMSSKTPHYLLLFHDRVE